jgi:Tol biopolymer transport system component
MGEVYRASDSRLHREVAIKVTAAQFSERFEREAHAIAALNHPNICHVYDVGPNYLVMELVEGPTLADRLKQGAMALDEALLIARQIGEALEAAHEKRIVHRDLKPGNIKIRPDGTVKVLDFGLAKMAEEVALAGNPENSPTLTLRQATMEQATGVGAVMGTAPYMAPEQARGKPVDKRADIWAFGVVLYEMLAGQRLFGGETISDTLAAVLKEEPKWDRVPARTQRLLRSCLERDPRQRLRDLGDAWRLLDESPPPPPAAALRPWIGWVAAALLVAAGLPLAFVHFRERPPVTQPVRFQIPAPASSLSFTLSPDGRQFAFLAPGPEGFSVWVRALDSLEPRLLAGTGGALTPPFWSPDSRFVAFEAGGKLKKAAAAGGLPQIICDLQKAAIGGAWNRDGVIIFGAQPGIQQVPEGGGTATPVTVARQRFHLFPSFLPDGRHFIYLSASDIGGGTIYVGSLDAKPEQQEFTRLLDTSKGPVYAPSADPSMARLLFMREGTLMAQPFNARQMKMAGEPVSIADQVGTFRLSASITASANDILAYRGGNNALSKLTWFDRDGNVLSTVGEPGTYADVALSPDGKRVATTRTDAMGQNIWLLELARGAGERLTFDPGPHHAPVWSPDCGRIAFNFFGAELRQKGTGGPGKEETVLQSGLPSDWSRDGRFLLYATLDSKTKYDLWALPLTGNDRNPISIARTEFNERQGQFSPDTRWVAYVSDESGRPEVYVQPFPPSSVGSNKIPISQSGGDQPRWRRNGKELFYFSLDGKLMSVDVTSSPAFHAGIPKHLFSPPLFYGDESAPYVFRWDVAADGQRFLIDTIGSASDPVTVVLNWTAELRK